MRHRRAQSGFALLLALALVLIAGAVLAAMARRSLSSAIEAKGAVEELQRRWAVASCRATLLPHAEDLLDEAERGTEPNEGRLRLSRHPNSPLSERRIECRLAGIDYELVFTDEQAKLNLNRALDTATRAETQSAVERLARGAGDTLGPPLTVHLRPLAVGENLSAKTAVLLRVGGYDQVFEGASPARLVGGRPGEGLARKITCWGDGKVNLRRASPDAIEQACEKTLGRRAVADLIAARDRDPYRRLADMLPVLGRFDDEQRAKVRDCLTDRSTCHGLWVIARCPQRSWYTLAVGVGGESGDAHVQRLAQTYEFEW